MKSQTFKKIGVGFLRGLLFTVTALFLLVTIGLGALATPLLQKDAWVAAVTKDSYITSLRALANNAVEDECLFYGLESEELSTLPGAEEVRTFSAAYIGNLYDTIFTGEHYKDVAFSPSLFRTELKAYFDQNPEEAVDDETLDEIATALATVATEKLNILPIDSIIEVAHLAQAPLLTDLLGIGLLVLCFFSLLFLALSFLLGAKSRLIGGQRTAGIFWCISALWFIPFTVFNVLNLPSKLALDGVMRLFVTHIGNAYLMYVQQILSLVFGIATVLLILLTVLRIRKENEERFGDQAEATPAAVFTEIPTEIATEQPTTDTEETVPSNETNL